ncbi:hypothetical protein MPDQ_003592 [Monascus purpureus]|uniref:Uncharacterized protein n=1 Tax=Monascus purpureus TaxID=5098 RepID=A0A507QKM6_MONPU|nr:hypothetical protein MPDQ_003592 [Monascus purpureus]BDD60440.1 hypothetical protein MAP00_005567 [Monascus purpureus]
MAAPKDSAFWRHFAKAIENDEKAKALSEGNRKSVSPDSWLEHQRYKKRWTFIWGFVLLFMASLAIAAVVVVIWWFASHNWLRG